MQVEFAFGRANVCPAGEFELDVEYGPQDATSHRPVLAYTLLGCQQAAILTARVV